MAPPARRAGVLLRRRDELRANAVHADHGRARVRRRLRGRRVRRAERLVTALLLAGAGLGLFLAAQVGPVTLLIVRSVLRGGRALLVGLAMAAAVALVDLLYATLGLFGAAQLLGGGTVRTALGLTSGAILVAIGARTAWIGFQARVGFEAVHEVVVPGRAFVMAIAATALNPLTIALWTVSFPAAAPAAANNSA